MSKNVRMLMVFALAVIGALIGYFLGDNSQGTPIMRIIIGAFVGCIAYNVISSYAE